MRKRKRIDRIIDLFPLKDRRVFVYRNLSYRDEVVWSGKSVSLGQVVFHRSDVLVLNPYFKVSKAGQARVRREGKKYVHAGVQGIILAPEMMQRLTGDPVRVTYNPYRDETFVRCDNGQPIFEAKYAVINEKGVFVYA